MVQKFFIFEIRIALNNITFGLDKLRGSICDEGVIWDDDTFESGKLAEPYIHLSKIKIWDVSDLFDELLQLHFANVAT